MFGTRGLLLGFDDDTLKFFENRELLVGRVDFCVTLLRRSEKACFFEATEFTLDISWVFLDEFSEAANVRLEVWVLGVHYNNLATNS